MVNVIREEQESGDRESEHETHGTCVKKSKIRCGTNLDQFVLLPQPKRIRQNKSAYFYCSFLFFSLFYNGRAFSQSDLFQVLYQSTIRLCLLVNAVQRFDGLLIDLKDSENQPTFLFMLYLFLYFCQIKLFSSYRKTIFSFQKVFRKLLLKKGGRLIISVTLYLGLYGIQLQSKPLYKKRGLITICLANQVVNQRGMCGIIKISSIT